MKNNNWWVIGGFVGACSLGQALMLGAVVAAPELPRPVRTEIKDRNGKVMILPTPTPEPTLGPLDASVPRPPSGELMAKFLGFPAGVKLHMERRASSLLFEKWRPLLAVSYDSEKQTPCLFSVEIYKAGALFAPRRAELEKQLETSMNDIEAMRREEAEEEMIKRGLIPRPLDADEKLMQVEVRPDGRKVFSSVFGFGPGGSVTATFSTVGEYDVVFIQMASTPDGEDPEETERVSHMVYPTKMASEVFAQMERVMPIFPQLKAVPDAKEEAKAARLAREAVIRAAPAPRPPMGAELEKCLGFASPVHLKGEKVDYGNPFFQVKPLWVAAYYGSGQLGGHYVVALYPARSLFGDDREWMENWLEHPVPFVTAARERRDQRWGSQPHFKTHVPPSPDELALLKQNQKRDAFYRQKRLVEAAQLLSPQFTRVETRADGRKVFFHVFDMMSDKKAPVAFSTIGDYDVVLTQVPEDFEEPEVVAKRKPIRHRDVLQAFGELEGLFVAGSVLR